MPEETCNEFSEEARPSQAALHPEHFFATTHWSVVLAAGEDSPQAGAALETLSRTYWYPLYSYARRCGGTPEDSQDLTQEFFARFLERGSISSANPSHGRFRWFLLACFKHFRINEREHANARKRGGGQRPISLDAMEAEHRYQLEPRDLRSPDQAYDRAWALTILERARGKLRDEFASTGRAPRYDVLEAFLPGASADTTYADIARQLGVAEGTVKSDVSRLRRRYGELLREEVAATVGTHVDLVDELRHLIEAVSG